MDPFISFDGQTLYFTQNSAVYFARKTDTGFGEPVQITAVLSPEGADTPVVRHDELVLYFASARTDGTAQGGSDVWVSRRAAADEDFALPSAVNELNTSDHEQPVWIAEDGCEIFIIRQTSSGSNVMVARRPL